MQPIYYGPWRDVFGVARYVRPILGGGECRVYWSILSGMWSHYYTGREFSSPEEAMSDLDDIIRAKGGILLTQEQFDKLSVLI